MTFLLLYLVYIEGEEEEKEEEEVKPWSHDWPIAAGAYLRFCSMKRLGVSLLPLGGMLVHCRSLPHNLLGSPNKSPVHLGVHLGEWMNVLVIYRQIVMSSGKHACLHFGKHAYPGLSLRAVVCSTGYSWEWLIFPWCYGLKCLLSIEFTHKVNEYHWLCMTYR